MGKIATKMPNFCLNRIRPLVRVRSSPMQSKSQENSINVGDEEKKDDHVDVKKDDTSVEKNQKKINGRKVMIVVDSSVEAKNALQWALSHTVQNQDMLVLLHVTNPTKQGDQSKVKHKKVPEFLTSMKCSCLVKRPEVVVEVVVVEGKDKGPAIVAAAQAQGAALLVVGQKKRSVTWRLMLMWAGGRRRWSGGVLCPKCYLYGNCGEEEKQESWWISYHH